MARRKKKADWRYVMQERMAQLYMTQQELADTIGVTKGLINHYLNGRRNPSIKNLKKLANALGLTLQELMESESVVIARADEQALLMLHRSLTSEDKHLLSGIISNPRILRDLRQSIAA